ncbi:SMP-30/gluconolactonase/LRE family protein [Streptomyces sp. NPDC057638]|uniref:SMP-30/gluconolactonase/LRE family protein n=1 Tax=Streptomyces sp. NPDC057638 TaxID=3346190 RepID=UPI0036BDCDDA
MRAEEWAVAATYHGEGPCWDPVVGKLRLVDQLAGNLLTFEPDTTHTRRHVGDVAAAWRPRAAGGLVVAVERGFALVTPEGQVSPGNELWSDTTLRMNDGGCDPAGNFYCGTMAYDFGRDRARVFRLTPEGDVSVVHSGASLSNGLVWSLDGTFAYYVDTLAECVARVTVDPESGHFSTPEPWVTVDPGQGYADGLALDSEGGLWVALWKGGAVHRYTPDGVLDAVVEVNARQVTACAFGGDDYSRLFITTSRLDIAPGDDPAAGTVFAVDPGVKGAAPLLFAG